MPGKELFDLITIILTNLFESEHKQLTNRIAAIIPRQAYLGGSADGFRYQSRVYTHLAGQMKRMGRYDNLLPSLVPEMDLIVAEQATNQLERERIRQALALALWNTKTPQDRRDALPNCLQDLVPECSGLERTREEAYTLTDNPRAYSQYMQLREKIEFYVAARLLY
jgi:hypothetical protein